LGISFLVSSSVLNKSHVSGVILNSQPASIIQQTASNGKKLIYVPLGSHGVGLELFCDENAQTVDSGNIVKTNGIILKQETMPPHLAIMCYYERMILKKESSIKYTGQINTFSLKNKFRFSYSFGAGDFISMTYHAPVKSQQITIKSDGKSPEPPVKKDGQNCTLMGLFAIYEFHVELIATWYECTQDGGGGTATPPECLPPSLAISISSGQQYVRTDSDCNEGQGGATHPDPPAPIVRIWNNTYHDCIRKLLDATMSNVNSLTKMLATEFTPGVGYALNYMERSIPNPDQPNMDPNTDAYISAYWQPNNFRHLNVVLNADIITYQSQEYAAATMLHEALHGFILANSFIMGEDASHVEMGNKYVAQIAGALHSMFPNLPPVDCMGLAWGGLEFKFVAAYNKLDPAAKATYSAVNVAYNKGGTKGTRKPVSGNCN
jgi:hypothetical protein